MKKSSEELLQELQEVDALIAQKRPLTGAERQRLKEIRERGFLANLRKGVIEGKSLKESISEGFKAKVVGIQEKFNPLNIAKSLVGKTGASILGKTFGASKDSMKYFLGDKKSSMSLSSSRKLGNVDTAFYTTVREGQGERLRKGDGIADVAGKLFNLIKKHSENNKLNYELERNFEQELHEEEERRHQELIEQIKKSQTSKMSKKVVKTPTTKKETIQKIPKEEIKSEIQKTTSKEKTPNVFRTNPERIAIPIVAGVAAAAVGGSAIAAAESGGDPDLSFGDRKEKTGKIVNSKGYPTPEKLFGKKLTEMTLGEVKEFGRIRSSISPNSGATGKYQFMPSTLFGSSKNPGLVQQLGLSMDTLYDEKTQDLLYSLFNKQSRDALTARGVPITPGNEYMAHYIGPAGAAAVYYNKDSAKTVAEVMADANLTPPGKANNPELYKIKADDFEKILEKRISGKTSSPHVVGQTDVGNKAIAAFKENKDLKGTTKPTNIALNTSQTINNIGAGQSTQVLHTGNNLDLPLFMTTQYGH